jgi:hypothetical protein
MTDHSQQRIFPLAELEVESMVNDAGEPFIAVRAKGTMRGEPMLLVGQLDTQSARLQGMTFIEAAEAADTDAALFGFTVETADDGATDEQIMQRAAAFVSALRNYRRSRAGEPTVEAIPDDLPDVNVGGLIRVGSRYYRAPSVPSAIGWVRDSADTHWEPATADGKVLERVADRDLTNEVPTELIPPEEG